jgi:hypothetical protein
VYCFGKGSKFNLLVLKELQCQIRTFLGHRFYGIENEEFVLYSLASNCDIFGTEMFRYKEKQIYKKFLVANELPPLAPLDSSLMIDLKFHARFLAKYVAKTKKDRILRNKTFAGNSFKEEAKAFEESATANYWKLCDKWKKRREKHLEFDQSECEIFTTHESEERRHGQKLTRTGSCCWVRLQLNTFKKNSEKNEF